MAYQLFNLPPQQPLSAAGRVLPGSKLSFFLTTTSTPTPVYTTSALNVAHTQPLIADAGGRFAAVYLDPTIVYKATVTDANDVLLYTVDPVNDQLLSQAVIGQYLYPQTAAEISAGITPTNYAYPPLDVRRYGAVLDGVTDDTDAFEAAILVAYTAGGGAVTFNGSTVVANVELNDNVSIAGVGNPTMILNAANASDVALAMRGTLGAATDLDANAAQGEYEVSVASATGFAVGDWIVVQEDTFIQGSDGQKMQIEKIVDIDSDTITLSGELLDSYTTAANASIAKVSGANSVQLSGFSIHNTSATLGGCIDIRYAPDFLISNVHLSGASGFASLKTYYGAHGIISDCVIKDTQGATVGSSVGLALYFNDSHHITVSGCMFRNYNQNAFDMRCRMWAFVNNICHGPIDDGVNSHGDGNSDGLIAGNVIDGCGNVGIAVGFSSNVSGDARIMVINNIIRNCVNHGISVSSASGKEHQNITVRGNHISGFRIGGTSAYGITASFANDILIEGNHIDGTTVGNATDACININTCTRPLVTNNVCINSPSGYGINLTSCVDWKVNGNRFYNVSNNVNSSSSTGTNFCTNNVADDTTDGIEASVIEWGNSWNATLETLSGSKTYNPGLFSDGAGSTTTVTVTGAALGDYVVGVSGSVDYQGVLVTGWVSAADTASVRFQNETGGNVTIGSHTLSVLVRKQ